MNDLMINDTSDTYVSFAPDTFEGKLMLYNAINSPDERLSDHINEQIDIQNFVVTQNEKMDDEGEISTSNFIVLIDSKGVSYGTSSKGIYRALKTLVSVFGLPSASQPWAEPISVKVKQVTFNGDRKCLTLELIKK